MASRRRGVAITTCALGTGRSVATLLPRNPNSCRDFVERNACGVAATSARRVVY
ncbi:hypothetical protein TcasGA2_TC005414 [Tribolium castaneum]|uniref:Uncharacterized protein n=1 Tax=Tribolium castaneum TaxID=7070 RepID=D6WYY4_TRICA|nr:hypothetical protein TcasGA2_TC005414 [Tribolium castaneum]